MARLMATAKKGFYPFPPDLLPEVVKWLSISDPEKTIILDPCAGEGNALLDVSSGLGIPIHNLYANELDEERAESCRTNGLVNVISGDALTEAVFGKCSLLWLNPPYDNDVIRGCRLERSFLSLSRNLAHSGVLAFIVPFKILRLKEFNILPQNFKRIRVLVFPDEYGFYGQCIVLAYKRSGETFEERDNWRRQCDCPMKLGTPPDVQYKLPHVESPPSGKFVTKKISQEMFELLLHRKEVQIAHSLPSQRNHSKISTLMPLRSGHQAVTLATGALDGVYKDPDTGHTLVILGKTELVETQMESEEGTESRKTRIMPRPQVIAWDLTASVATGVAVLIDYQ